MADLLIHIGFPKTATTTLQENVFFELHQMGLINYLGCLRFNKSKFGGTDITNSLRKSYYIFDNEFDILPYLVEDKINVISDEKLTLPSYYLNLQHDSNASPFDFIKNYISRFNQNINVSILISIRNQADLIYSQFLQKYKFLYHEASIKHFETLKDLVSNSSRGFEVYNLNLLIDQFTNQIDKKVIHVVIFESLKDDDNIYYFKSLSKALNGIDVNIIQSLFLKEIFRNRNSKDNGNEISFYKPKFPWLGKIFKFRMKPNNILQRFSNKLFIESFITIPFINEMDAEEILRFYNNDNKIFWKKMNLPNDLGIRYKYLV